tara:strand:+ start:487 stop:672 length:186 start_codon:yes stop_codon:yes gene_type:complete
MNKPQSFRNNPKAGWCSNVPAASFKPGRAQTVTDHAGNSWLVVAPAILDIDGRKLHLLEAR